MKICKKRTRSGKEKKKKKKVNYTEKQ